MTRNEVLHEVIKIVNKHKLDVFPNATENSRLYEDLAMDSFDIAETVMRVEVKFDLIGEIEATEIKLVKDLANCVCKKLNIPVADVQKKSNQKLNVLYPIIACMLFAGCTICVDETNVVVVPGKNKIIVKDVTDYKERLFYTNRFDDRFQYLHAGDTINVLRNKNGYYYCDKIFNDDNIDAHIDSRDLHNAKQKFQFDSIKNAMLMDSVAQNKR